MKETKNKKEVIQGVYMILDTRNNKVYIGSSTSIVRRKREHFKELKSGKHHNPILQSIYNKYGKDVLQFSLLEVVKEQDQLHIREKYWITEKDAYNRDKGYNFGIPGQSYSQSTNEETKHKLRLIALKRHYGDLPEDELLAKQEELALKKEEASTGMNVEEFRNHIIKTTGKSLTCVCNKTNKVIHEFNSFSEAMRELSTSDGSLRRVLNKPHLAIKGLVIMHSELYDSSKSYLKQYKPKVIAPKKPRPTKPVNSYTKDGTFLKTYTSVKEAAEDIGGNIKGIRKSISGERHSHRDLVFSYKE